MKRMGILFFSFLMSINASAARMCSEFFSDVSPFNNNIFKEKVDITLLPERFGEMRASERLRVLSVTIDTLKALQPEKPDLWQLAWSANARDRNKKHKDLLLQINELQNMQEIYKWTEPIVRAMYARANFNPVDEAYLLNRVVLSEGLFQTLKFVNQRYMDIKNKVPVEQSFLDAVVYYITWGPDASKFPIPFYHWVIFDILKSRENIVLLTKLTRLLRVSGSQYRSEKIYDNAIDAAIDDYWLIQQDPVMKVINEDNPRVIEKVIEMAVENRRVDYGRRTHQLQVMSLSNREP